MGIAPFEFASEPESQAQTPQPMQASETKIKQAMTWLRMELMSGPRPASEMEKLAEAKGFTSATMYKARRRAGVRSERKDNQWVWSLAAQRKLAAKSKVSP